MKYLKDFYQLFEEEEADHENTGGKVFSRDEIMALPSYKEAIEKYGLIDTTSNAIAKSGGVRFSPKDSPNEYYTIFTNGYIRIQNKNELTGRPWDKRNYKWSRPQVIITPYGNELRDMLYGRDIKNVNDYDIKFDWLGKYINKRVLRSRGDSTYQSNKDLSNTDPNVISPIINDIIKKSKNNSPELLKKFIALRNKGKYIPDEHAKVILDLSGHGLF